MGDVSDDKVLAVEPEVTRYTVYGDGPGFEELMEALQSQRDTQPVAIRAVTDALLNDDGLIQGKFRLTTTALQQLCSVLSPGLTEVVRSISGLRPRKGRHSSEKHSIAQAIALLNQTVKFRFNLVQGSSFVIDQRNRQVEGFVGPKYRFLSNLEMQTRVDEFLRTHARSVRFWEAALAGRRLLLRYRATDRAFALTTPHKQREPFYAGIHFSNSELGDCCVKGSPVVYRQWTKTAAIMPFSSETKLVHFDGEDFNGRLRSLLTAVCELFAEVTSLADPMRNLLEQRLGLGGPEDDHKQRLQEIISSLVKGDVTRKWATDAMNRALVHGSYKVDDLCVKVQPATEMLDPNLLRAFSRRSAFDVFNAICHIARNQRPATQELLEQRAYALLNGSFEI